MDTKEFIAQIESITKNVFSISLPENVLSILEELVENYKIFGNLAGSPIQNLVEPASEPVLQVKRIFKGKNQKDEDVLLIYFEDAHGIILNLSFPEKSQIGTLPLLKL